ncbi:MAG: GNAT family N-acetyltransferase [Burkholderiales bacterium]
MISLRTVDASAAPTLADLRVAAMRESLESAGRFDPERARARFLDAFDPSCTREILDDGTRVGLIVVRHASDHVLLDHLYILPSAQGRGIGSDVVGLVIAEADVTGKPLRVGALKESRSNEFYRRHGFVPRRSSECDHHYERPAPPA